MPDAVDVAVAKAVVAELEAASFSQTIEPERSDGDWEIALEDDGSRPPGALYVDVVTSATGKQAELHTRGSLLYTVPVDIAIRKRFGEDTLDDETGKIDQDEKDALKLLTQEVFELFMPARLTTYEDAVWNGDTKILVCPVKEHLRQNRQFTSVIRLTFEIPKAI